MELVQLITWSIVELKNPKPDLDAVRKCLDKALAAAVKLDLSHEARKAHLIRIAKVNGESL